MTLTIGLPSKGRMKQDTLDAFAQRGFNIQTPENDRNYRGTLTGHDDIEIAFMSASEIARELGKGTIDFGVTGEDLIRETLSDFDNQVEICARLGFGNADVIVAIPDFWYDVETMADLADVASIFRKKHGRRLTIATKYWRLTQQFFTSTHGIRLYRIVESLGATEGAPASGGADIIVDITSTGSTLKANQLRILSDGLILSSQACLIKSTKAAQDKSDLVNIIMQAFTK